MTASWKQWVLDPGHKAVLSFSGGKDSTALYLQALDWGVDFLPVFADTGHEHEYTYDYQAGGGMVPHEPGRQTV